MVFFTLSCFGDSLWNAVGRTQFSRFH
ncbi:rCG45299 [Rattus norvegicus]|uniref:RCG45299 n=1 Tax=Rattus norvegicus TaxID=10116 RepID=A6K9B4_RAT|nr:rCG45299 [Rattus norvegicus]